MPGPFGSILGWAASLVGVTGGATLAAEASTGGGDPEPHPTWDVGWYRGARRAPAHPGRVGGRISPWAVVVHTTDMHPDTWPGLQRRLQREPGAGNGAHFWIGRDADQGLVQAVPCDRNANHAGGPSGHHGWFEVAGRRVHPNLVTIGIEVHCAGAVISRGGRWYAIDRSKDLDGDGDLDVGPTGAPLPDEDVEPDPARPGHGWHRPSAYQLGELAGLLGAISRWLLRDFPPHGWSVLAHTSDDRAGAPVFGAVVPGAPQVLIGGVPVVGHWTLDPRRKGDPWPPISRWLQGQTST